MPVYEYKGQFYDLSETDPAAAKAKILRHLGQAPAPVASAPVTAPAAAFVDAPVFGTEPTTGLVEGADYSSTDPFMSAITPPEPKIRPKSVLEGVKAPPPLPTEDPMIRPEFVTAMERRIGALPAQERAAALANLTKRPDVYGRAARVVQGRMGVLEAQQPKPSLISQMFDTPEEQARKQALAQPEVSPLVSGIADPRLEAQVAKLVTEGGMEAGAAEAYARQELEQGRIPRVLPMMRAPTPGEVALERQAQQYEVDQTASGIETAIRSVQRIGKAGELALGKAGGGMQLFLGEMSGADVSGVKDKLGYIAAFNQAMGENPYKPLQIIESAGTSIVQQLPALVAGAITGSQPLVLASMYANSFGDTYADGRERGLDKADSTARAAIFGAFEVLGEKFGLGASLDLIKGAAKGKPLSELAGYFAKQITKEIPGEQLTYAGQFATDKGFGLNPEAGIEEFLRGAAETAIVTATQAGMMLGGAAATSKALRAVGGVRYTPEAPPSVAPPTAPPIPPAPPAQKEPARPAERIEPTIDMGELERVAAGMPERAEPPLEGGRAPIQKMFDELKQVSGLTAEAPPAEAPPVEPAPPPAPPRVEAPPAEPLSIEEQIRALEEKQKSLLTKAGKVPAVKSPARKKYDALGEQINALRGQVETPAAPEAPAPTPPVAEAPKVEPPTEAPAAPKPEAPKETTAAPKPAGPSPMGFRKPTKQENSVDGAVFTYDVGNGARLMFEIYSGDIFIAPPGKGSDQGFVIRAFDGRSGTIERLDQFPDFIPRFLQKPLLDYHMAVRQTQSVEQKKKLAQQIIEAIERIQPPAVDKQTLPKTEQGTAKPEAPTEAPAAPKEEVSVPPAAPETEEDVMLPPVNLPDANKNNKALAEAVEDNDWNRVTKQLQRSKNPLISAVGKMAENLIGVSTQVNPKVFRGLPKNVPAGYDPKGGGIYVRNKTGASNEHVVAHETVHALTIDALRNPTEKQKSAVNRLNNLYEYVKNRLGKDGKQRYGLTNIEEFIAEGNTNVDFQRELARIPYQRQTAWGAFTKTIADLLGIKDSRALTELIALTEELSSAIPQPLAEETTAKEQPPQLTPPPGFKVKKGRNEQVVLAARELAAGRISKQEYDRYVDFYTPIETVLGGKIEQPISDDLMTDILTKKIPQKKDPKLVNAPIADGARVGLRMDIPALEWGRENGVNGSVVSIHQGADPSKARGKNVSYKSTGHLKNVVFAPRSEEASFGIAQMLEGREGQKKPQHTMEGEWVNTPADETFRLVKSFLDDPNWVQVSLDPLRHSFFYARDSKRPVLSADEALQVGRFVLVKNPVYGDRQQFLYSIEPESNQIKDIDSRLPVVKPGEKVDGLIVREDVPNMSSIAASLENYQILPGIRAVPINDFGEPTDATGNLDALNKRTRKLAELISESNEINPLIVVYSGEGNYILEGAHRIDALDGLGKQTIPAVVVIDQNNPPILYSIEPEVSRRTPLGFYSALANGIEGIKTNAAPVSGWKEAIKGLVNKGAVKADEVEWSGVNDWLDLQQGRVTKEDLLNYLRQNGVQVEETVLGGRPSMLGGDMERLLELQDERELTPEEEKQLRELRATPKFGRPDLVLPGGENYREVLLRLPSGIIGADAARLKELTVLIDEKTAGYDALSEDERRAVRAEIKPLREERAAIEERRKRYKSTHWDQPNVIAHIRMNDRTDADGNKVLFIEEIQSDWGQEGKKKGFRSKNPIEEKEGKFFLRGTNISFPTREQAERQREILDNTVPAAPFVATRQFVVYKDGKELVTQNKDGKDVRHRYDKADAAQAAADKFGGEVRDMGMQVNTEGWLNLALKRIMVMAAEGGYDKVAFVNGEQSADRYDLSKQVRELLVDRIDDEEWSVRAFAKEGDEDRSIDRDITSLSELDDLVGKEVADRARIQIEQEGRARLRGLDLKVGGEGMKAFYDQIVPQAVKKLLPKVGGDGMSRVQIPDESSERGTVYDIVVASERVADRESPIGSAVETHTSRRMAEQAMEGPSGYDSRDYRIVERDAGQPMLEQPGFDVTPAMREKVETTGLPLFSLNPSINIAVTGNPAQRSPSFKREVAKLKGLHTRGLMSDEAFAKRIDDLIEADARRRFDKQMADIAKGRVRGADWILEKLRGAKRKGEISDEAYKLAEWFINGNPRLVEELGISIVSPGERGVAGQYDVNRMIMVLVKGRGNDLTAVHEILHHLERMMPPDIQAAIRKEWTKQLLDAKKKAKTPQEKLYYEALMAHHFGEGRMSFDNVPKELRELYTKLLAIMGVEGERVNAMTLANHLLKTGGVDRNLYQYYSPSEFWAVNGSDIVRGRYDAIKGGLLTRLKNWLRELGEKIKSIFGLKSEAALIRALDSLAKADGKFVTKQILDQTQIAYGIEPEKTQTNTPEFKRWFGDSKVVDENGEPLVVYRGMEQEIQDNRFRVREDGGTYGPGIYASTNPQVASFWAGDREAEGMESDFGGSVYPVYISLQNPADGGTASDIEAEFGAGARDEMIRRGYDGVMADGGEIVAFYPEQIKSATGNIGTFDPTDPNILYSIESDRKAAPKKMIEPVKIDRLRESWTVGRDELGRRNLGPGAKAYDTVARITNVVLDKILMKPISPELGRAMRNMKVEIDKAQKKVATLGKELSKLSSQERELISDVIEGELKADVIPPQHIIDIAASMVEIMSAQGQEMMRLGMLSKEAFMRWENKYLPRFYLNNLGKEAKAWATATKRLLMKQPTMQGIKGQQLKSRGMYQQIYTEDLPDWIAQGWEQRDADFDPKTSVETVVWRDYTREEREEMGEIRDAMFRFVMGYNASQRDIALGRLYESLSENYASKSPIEGYVRVPETMVEGTNVNRYGKLAGMYVPKEIMDHLVWNDKAMSNGLYKLYQAGLGRWKEGKTVLNPTAHANNVFSNFTMAHFAGVSYWDVEKYAGALKDFIKNDEMLKEAEDIGLFTGTFSQTEMVENMPAELKQLANMTGSQLAKYGDKAWDLLSLTLEWDGKKYGVRPMMKWMYENEDFFFRYLIYRDARNRGMEPEDAREYSNQFIFTYDDLPAGARVVRDIGMPFFSYTYKVVPVLARTALEYPWRFALPAAAVYTFNALMYSIAASVGGDEDDWWGKTLYKYVTDKDFRQKANQLEEEERKNLPSWMKGKSSLGTEKAIRLGMDDITGLPLFLDISRIFPGGDLLDAENNAGGFALLQPLTPSNPVLTSLVAMLANKDMFLGKDVVLATDTDAEKARKRAAWLWKQWAPSISVGNYHFDRGMNTIANMTGKPITVDAGPMGVIDYTGIGKDGLPVIPKYAALQTFGVKVRPYDLEVSAAIEKSKQDRLIKELAIEIKRINRLEEKGSISPAAAELLRSQAQNKQELLKDGLTVEGKPKK